MSRVQYDLTGQVYGRLLVIGKSDKKDNKKKRILWACRCSCGNSEIKHLNSTVLTKGITKSCGCIRNEKAAERQKKSNEFKIVDNEYVIGYTTKGEEFFIDLDDLERVSQICWYKDNSGYIVHKTRTGNLKLHRFILNADDSDIQVDHKNNKMKNDNRKENLRFATHKRNQENKPLRVDNISGITGVTLHNATGKWRARIVDNRKEIHLGLFLDFDEAVKKRLEAENKYYQEFAPQRHLFEQYGIEL